MKQHSEDFKIIVVKYYQIHSFEDTFKIFNCNRRTVIRWNNQYNLTNSLQRKERTKGYYKINQEHINYAISYLKINRTATLSEINIHIINNFPTFTISNQHLGNILRNNNYTRKRTRHGHFPILKYGKEVNIRNNLKNFYDEIKKYPIDKIISIDETSLRPFMFRKYGRSKSGYRCIETTNNLKVFSKHTFIASITNNKILTYELYDKNSITVDRLESFLKNMIKQYKLKNYVFLLDNFSVHKHQRINDIITKSGNKLLYAVPYNPQTNPIENWFSQFKYWMSTSKMRTFEDMKNDIKSVINKISTTHYSNYFKNAFSYH